MTKAFASPAASARGERKIELDFLRGVAILLVMVAHFRVPSTGTVELDEFIRDVKAVGGVGVNLFFTLSGFLVGGLLLTEYQKFGSIDVRRFLVRRALKIWPALYFLVLVHAVIRHHPIESFFWQNILHVQNYFGTSLNQTWSLAVEEHFYLLLAIFLACFASLGAQRLLFTLLTISVATVALRIWAVSQGQLDSAFRQTQYRIDSLCYGVILAVVYHYRRDIFDRIAASRKMLWLSLATLVTAIALTYRDPVLDRVLGYAAQGLGFSLLIVQVVTFPAKLSSARLYRAISWVGLYSYGIYLWHTATLGPGDRIIAFLQTSKIPTHFTWMIAITFQIAVALLLGKIMTALVEWPFLKIRDRMFPSRVSLASSEIKANGKGNGNELVAIPSGSK